MPPPDSVAVLIPVYNGSDFVREAIDSVLAQTHSRVECIVVDDGSTDDTWSILQSYGTRIRVHRKDNGGVASALNEGIRRSSAPYIAWLSHDDLFLPDKLAQQLEFLASNPQFSACYTDYYVIDGDGRPITEIESPWHPKPLSIRQLFGTMYINGSTMLIHRRCFERVGAFSEGLRYTQDAEMWLRILRHFDIGRVPQKLGKQRQHPAQGSRNFTAHAAEGHAMFRRLFDDLGVNLLFADQRLPEDARERQAFGHRWLAATMWRERRWLEFAAAEYGRSWRAWPSPRNPALMEALWYRGLLAARGPYRLARRALGRRAAGPA